MTPIVKVNLWDEQTGYPTPGLNTTRFTLVFSKLPNLQLFCNHITLPSITLGIVHQPSSYLDIKHVGEKLVYSDFTCEFILDQQLQGYKDIHEWMKRLSVQGLNSDNISNSKLLTDGGDYEFVNVYPIELSGIVFDTKQTDIIYPSCTVTFACDYYFPVVT